MTLTGIRISPAAAALLAAALFAPSLALAQTAPPGFVQFSENPADALARYMVAIAKDPEDVAALKGAADAALALDDPDAALSFLSRAEEAAPRDGSVKALIGSALVTMEQGRSALRFFGDAVALGVAESEVAGDRGLAQDLVGNQRAAQRDYQLSLKAKDDPEIRRRLALSLAISGDRAAALRTIEGEVRQQDRAAWRARAFILALTGDTEGASEAVRAVMPAQVAALRPFLARLPQLSPADRALAVHFGHFPEGMVDASAAAPRPAPADPGALERAIAAGSPDRNQVPLGSAPAAPVRLAEAPAEPPAAPAGSPPPAPPPARPATSPAKGEILGGALPDRNAALAAAPPAPSVAGSEEAGQAGFAEIAALVASLPGEAGARAPAAAAPAPAPPPQQQQQQQPRARKPQAVKPQPKKPAPPAEPRRVWVQIAGGANRDALPGELARLKAKAPKLFAGKTAWTAALKATNRLLVGPFRNEDEAQDFVNALARAELAGFTWTSEEGEAVRKLPAR